MSSSGLLIAIPICNTVAAEKSVCIPSISGVLAHLRRLCWLRHGSVSPLCILRPPPLLLFCLCEWVPIISFLHTSPPAPQSPQEMQKMYKLMNTQCKQCSCADSRNIASPMPKASLDDHSGIVQLICRLVQDSPGGRHADVLQKSNQKTRIRPK